MTFSTTNLGHKHAAHVLYFSLGNLAVASARTNYQLLADNVDHLSRDLNLMLGKRDNSSPGLPIATNLLLQ